MRARFHLFAFLLLSGSAVQQAVALETNYWPLFTAEHDEEPPADRWQVLGPIVFGETTPEQKIQGVRPLFIHFREQDREASSFHLLYPFFNARHRPYGTTWDIFSLFRYQSFTQGQDAEETQSLHLFPILFVKRDPDPEKSYFGVFPIAGQVHNMLSYDEITWFLFPLTGRFVRGEVTTWATPWPFIRFVRGPETRGFHLWPLYGQVAEADVSSHRYWLWPLGYRLRRDLWKEEPFEAFGFLPFYSSSHSEKAVSKTFVWPFFGYTHSDDPGYRYRETRYFWPLLVQRRGDSYINRWAPFHSHSMRTGEDRRWVMWPFHFQSNWEERNMRNDRTQFLYFLYWSNIQSSLAQPGLAPAIKQHVWPFYSYWDNGAGLRQFQAFSPLEPFFPTNDVVRKKYSPLFAFYRLDREEGVRSRHSLLFNFIAWQREPEKEAFQLDVGPLFHYERHSDGRAWEILKGLLSFSRDADDRSFGAFWFNRPDRGGDGTGESQAPPIRRPRRHVLPRRRIRCYRRPASFRHPEPDESFRARSPRRAFDAKHKTGPGNYSPFPTLHE